MKKFYNKEFEAMLFPFYIETKNIPEIGALLISSRFSHTYLILHLDVQFGTFFLLEGNVRSEQQKWRNK